MSDEFAFSPAVNVTFDGFNFATGPLPTIGESVTVRFATPENPLPLEKVRLAVAEEPAETIKEVEFAAIESPGAAERAGA